MESRPLRYFVAVAAELNFTRAAEKLGIASPPLSRAIRKLEADLGVTLFERSTHRVALTPAGSVLLEQAQIALDALDAAARRAQRAGHPEPKLVLAVKADSDAGLLETILARYAGDPAAEPVTVRLCGWGEQSGLLRRGEADAALVYEPFDRSGLDAETVAVEGRVVALPVGHRLVGRDHVGLAELDLPGGPDEFAAAVADRFGVRDLAQLLKLVELGDLVTVLPESVADRYPRPGVAYRPVPDAAPARLAIAWPQHSRSRAVAALVRTATASRHPDDPVIR